MPTTQHRPHGAYAGPVFGTLDGKAEDTSPPVEPPKTQHRPHGAFAGPVFGTLSGKTAESGGGFDLDVPTLGPALSGTFAASGDFAFSSAVIFNLEAAGPVALSGAIDASGDFSAVIPVPTVTLTLYDKSESGRSVVPDITGIEWAWWDDPNLTLAGMLATAPTDSGASESVTGGVCVLSLPSSVRTSGQEGTLAMRVKAGDDSRSLIDTVPVD